MATRCGGCGRRSNDTGSLRDDTAGGFGNASSIGDGRVEAWRGR